MKGIVGDYAIRRQYAADGLTLTEAAALLGITRHGLYVWSRANDVAFAAEPVVSLEGPRLTEEEVAARVACHAAGMTLRQAAAHLKITHAAMRHWARRAGLKFNRDFSSMGLRRLPADEHAKRLACADEGLTVTEAARKLGLGVGALSIWAQRAGVRFIHHKSGRPRKAACDTASGKTVRPAPPPAPLSGAWMAARLTEGERADYKLLRSRGGYSALQALASIRRPDLVAEVEAHLQSRKATA